MPLEILVFGIDTRLVILAAGVMFLWALLLGVMKFRQILASPEGQAHPYTDIAHRAALLYAFALMLIAVFVQLSALHTEINLAAAGVLAFFFFAAVASYMRHGLRRDTVNQLVNPSTSTRLFVWVLAISEIVAFCILLAGFIVGAFA
jgi:hypothetical protein